MAIFLNGEIMVTLTEIENTEAGAAFADSIIISVWTHYILKSVFKENLTFPPGIFCLESNVALLLKQMFKFCS